MGPRREEVVTGPAGQRDYELMGLGAVCCSLLHWFKPGRAVGRARDCQDHRCLSRVGALGWIGNSPLLEWEGDRQERCRLSTSIYAAICWLLAAGKGEGVSVRERGVKERGRAQTRCGEVWLGLWFGASLLCCACGVVCCALLCSALLCSVLLCLVPVGCWPPTFGSSPPSSPPLLLHPPPLPCTALPCSALPHPIPSLEPCHGRLLLHLSAAVVTLLAFSLLGLWLAGPLGNQPKAPSPHPSKLQARMPRARAPRFRFEGHRNATNAVAPQHHRLRVPGTTVAAVAAVAAAGAAGCRRRKTRDLGRGCRCRVPQGPARTGDPALVPNGGSP